MGSFWVNLIIIVHVLIALAIIGLVLLQHGKGADMGSGFGGGASSSLFGATGSANFLSRMTGVLATIFFLTSLGLAYVANLRGDAGIGVMDAVKEQPVVPAQQVPAAGDPTPAPAQAAPANPDSANSKQVPN